MLYDIEKKNQLINELSALRGLPYLEGSMDPKNGGLYCWGLFHHAFLRAADIFDEPELVLPEDVYIGESSFRLVNKTKDRVQFLDIAVMREHAMSKRHVGLMIDERWFFHCSKASNGVARAEITRDPWRQLVTHYGRHKKLDAIACS